MRQVFQISEADWSELLRLSEQVQKTPVIALSVADGLAGRDFASWARTQVMQKWAEIGAEMGFDPESVKPGNESLRQIEAEATNRRSETDRSPEMSDDKKTPELPPTAASPPPEKPKAPKKPKEPKEATKPKAKREKSERKKGGFAVIKVRGLSLDFIEKDCTDMGDALKRLRHMLKQDMNMSGGALPKLGEGESYGIIQIKMTGIVPKIETITKVSF